MKDCLWYQLLLWWRLAPIRWCSYTAFILWLIFSVIVMGSHRIPWVHFFTEKLCESSISHITILLNKYNIFTTHISISTKIHQSLLWILSYKFTLIWNQKNFPSKRLISHLISRWENSGSWLRDFIPNSYCNVLSNAFFSDTEWITGRQEMRKFAQFDKKHIGLE